jgi:hypothetical protein
MRRAAQLGDGWMDQGNLYHDLEPTMAQLNQLCQEAGRVHLPFEIVMVLSGKPDLDRFRRAEELGVTAVQLLPAYFQLGKRSALDEKKKLWEDFAEQVIRHFPQRQEPSAASV